MRTIFTQFLGQMWKKWKNEHMSDMKKWYMVYETEKEKMK